jgi:hypothetical protein
LVWSVSIPPYSPIRRLRPAAVAAELLNLVQYYNHNYTTPANERGPGAWLRPCLRCLGRPCPGPAPQAWPLPLLLRVLLAAR